MTEARFHPVVALDLDGVIRVPHVEAAREFRSDVRPVEITMRQLAFPSYSHEEPPWDEIGEWTAVHAFSQPGTVWVHDLVARGITVVWASPWRAYANVYFGRAFGLPELPFIDVDYEADFALGVAHQLSRQFRGRPLLWVCADPPAGAGTTLPDLRGPNDRARTRAFVTESGLGIAPSDVKKMDQWLDLTLTAEGQDELRRSERRRRGRRRAVAARARWGSERRHRRWRAARALLIPALGPESTLLALLVDYALESGGRIDPAYVEELRELWGRPTDPPTESIVGMLALATQARISVCTSDSTWVGEGYPPALRGLVRRITGDVPANLRVGRGWWPLLARLDARLGGVDPGYTVTSVRAAGGHLEFQAETTAPQWYGTAFRRTIRGAVAEAAHTCERCGREGARRGDVSAVLCNEHARPLTDDEVAFAVQGGVPPEVFVREGAVDGTLFIARTPKPE